MENEDYGLIVNRFEDLVKFDVIQAEAKQYKEEQMRPLTEIRKIMTDIVDMTYIQKDQLGFQREIEIDRKLPAGSLHALKCFMVTSFEHGSEIFGEEEKDRHFGLINERGNPILAKRFVFPILGFNREVLGFIGYNKYNDVKYILSKTYMFGKNNIFFGMHMVPWIITKGYVIVVEGIFDAIWFWTRGVPAIALNGNAMPDFVTTFLKRFGYHVLLIPDNDSAGANSLPYWQKQLPLASTLQLIRCKDPDERRKVDNDENIFDEVIEEFLFNASIKNKVTLTL